MSYIEDSESKDEAAGAAIFIAYKLSGSNKHNKDAARQAMEKLIAVSSNDRVKSKAKRVLDGIKK